MGKTSIENIIQELSEGKILLNKREVLLKEAKKTQRKLKTLKTKYAFLEQLISTKQSKNSTTFELLIQKYFHKTGFKKVRHSGKNTDREDVHIFFNDEVFIIECRGKTSRNVSVDDVSQLNFRKMKIKNLPELQNKTLHFLMVFDHEYSKPLDKRKNNPMSVDVEDYLKNNINGGLATPLGLVWGYIKLKNNEITFNDYVEKLKTKGLIKF